MDIERKWEFDSHLEVTTKLFGTHLKQVWCRPSSQWPDTFEWTLTVDTPGKENPPIGNVGRLGSWWGLS